MSKCEMLLIKAVVIRSMAIERGNGEDIDYHENHILEYITASWTDEEYMEAYKHIEREKLIKALPHL